MLKRSTLQKIKPEMVIFITIIITSLLIYSQVKNYDFINFDDNVYVYENDHVKSGLTVDNILWAFSFSSDQTYWHPLTWLSHMLDSELFGLDAGMHHLSSVFLHIMNSLLLFIVLRLMTGAPWRSGVVAVLFAVHPVNVDSVAWVSERKNLLSTFFWFLTMLSYIYYSGKPDLKKYLATLVFFLMGLLAKPMLITLPCVLLLMDYWPLKRLQLPYSGMDQVAGGDASKQIKWTRLIIEKIPFFVISAVIIGVSMFSLEKIGVVVRSESVPMFLRISNALVSYITYMEKMIWPYNLTIYYPFPDLIPAWKTVGSSLILVVITVFSMINLRRKPYLSIGWLWFVGTLVPVSGLVQAGLWPAFADRWLYVPQIGFFICVVWYAADILNTLQYKKQFILLIMTLLLLFYGTVSTKQVAYWKNIVTLFTHALEVDSDNFIAHYRLGSALQKDEKFKDAMDHYFEAIRLKSGCFMCWHAVAEIQTQTGDDDSALESYYKALECKEDYIEAEVSISELLYKKGDYEAAEARIRMVLNKDPAMPEAMSILAAVLDNTGRADESYEIYKKMIELRPSDANVYFNLGLNRMKAEKSSEAISYLLKAVELNHNYFDAYNNLGAIYYGEGQFEPALSSFQKALEIDPENIQAKNNIKLAQAAMKQKTVSDDIKKTEKKLKENPDNISVLFALGKLYIEKGEPVKAVVIYKKIININPELFMAHNNLAITYIAWGKHMEAVSVYKDMMKLEPENNLVDYNLACVYAREKNADESVKWLRRAVEKGYSDLTYLKSDKDLENIRSSSAYQEFISDLL